MRVAWAIAWLLVGAAAMGVVNFLVFLIFRGAFEADQTKIWRLACDWRHGRFLAFSRIRDVAAEHDVSVRDVKMLLWRRLASMVATTIVGLGWAYLGARLFGPKP